jgi:hypothetical protein
MIIPLRRASRLRVAAALTMAASAPRVLVGLLYAVRCRAPKTHRCEYQRGMRTIQYIGVLHAEPGSQHAAVAASKANHGRVRRLPIMLQLLDYYCVVSQRLQQLRQCACPSHVSEAVGIRRGSGECISVMTVDTSARKSASRLTCVAVRYCMCCRMTDGWNGLDSP